MGDGESVVQWRNINEHERENQVFGSGTSKECVFNRIHHEQ